MKNEQPAGSAVEDETAYPAQAEPTMDEAESPDETCDIEHEGQLYRVPIELKGAFLRHADYTRKTQELAAHRRALEVERQAVAQQAQAHAGALSDRAHLAALDHQLAQFGGVDWQSFAESEPQRAQALWARFQQTHALREQYAQALAHHEHGEALAQARAHADEMAKTGATLTQEIEGWSPEVAAKLVDYAGAFGITLDELREAADPRVWKVLHRAWSADQATQGEAAGKAAAQVQTVRPAVMVNGAAAGGGGVRDELATKEWMTRRNAQTRVSR